MAESVNTRLANEIVSNRMVAGTKRQYERSLNELKQWLRTNKPECMESPTNIVVPLPKAVLLEFFGHISKKRDNSFKSYSTVNAYRSAISDHYFQRAGISARMRLSDDLTDFFRGYKRKVSIYFKLDIFMCSMYTPDVMTVV